MTSVVRHRGWWAAALAAYVVGLVVLVLAPTAGVADRVLYETVALARSLGAPRQLTEGDGGAIEFLYNVLMVAPVVAIGSILWPRPAWHAWTAWAFVTFCAVELLQGTLLPHRDGSLSDVVANTAGCCLGAVAVAVVRRVRPPAGVT